MTASDMRFDARDGGPADAAADATEAAPAVNPATAVAEASVPVLERPAYLALLQQTWWWCFWGVLLAALGWRVPTWTWPPTIPAVIGFAACALGFALLAVPVRDRPIAASARMHHVLIAHRNGVVAAGFVVLAATHRPQGWEPGLDALALAVYLLMLDAFSTPPNAVRRIAGPGVLTTLTLLIAASAVLIELPETDAAARQVTGVAGAAVAQAAALWAGFGIGRRK